MREAALRADNAARDVMKRYAAGRIKHEDDITPYLMRALEDALKGNIAGLEWDSSVLTHRGTDGGEEKRFGADALIHVKLDTPSQSYSKGVLIQAKRVEPDDLITRKELSDLISQCNRMLSVTPSAFVFDYARRGVRCGPATRLAGTARRDLYSVCGWTSYRFFLEFFRCPIGDPRITSASVEELTVPIGLAVRARGEFSDEGGTIDLLRG